MPENTRVPRLKPSDITMSDSMPFGQHWEARTLLPLEQCLTADFFMDVRGGFRAGDRINMIRYDNNKSKRVLEIVEGVRVIYVDKTSVEIFPYFTIQVLHKQGEEGIVVDRGYKTGFVIRVNGNLTEAFRTFAEAEKYADELSQKTGLPWQSLILETKKAA